MSAEPTAAVLTTECLVTILPIDDINTSTWSLRVVWRGRGLYAVTDGFRCLSIHGDWHVEPISSDRTDEWIAAHRYSYDDAIRLAKEHAPNITVNGLSATDVLARINAESGPRPGVAR